MSLSKVRSLADFLDVMRYHIRGIVETIHPPPPCVFTECSNHDCKENSVFVLTDKSVDLRVYVCLNHYKEIRNTREWDIEPA